MNPARRPDLTSVCSMPWWPTSVSACTRDLSLHEWIGDFVKGVLHILGSVRIKDRIVYLKIGRGWGGIKKKERKEERRKKRTEGKKDNACGFCCCCCFFLSFFFVGFGIFFCFCLFVCCCCCCCFCFFCCYLPQFTKSVTMFKSFPINSTNICEKLLKYSWDLFRIKQLTAKPKNESF